MFAWLNGPGRVFRHPTPGSTNYLSAYDQRGKLIRERDAKNKAEGDGKNKGPPPEFLEDLRPFPMNPFFHSEPVLSEELKDEIFRRVTVQQQTVRQVSQDLSVDMARVGAVVRLKAVENKWIEEERPLAKEYARSVRAMLPSTPLVKDPRQPQPAHEPINALPVHRDTLTQLFAPTSESKVFTRADAAATFSPSLLPADARIPHPQMVEAVRDRLQRGLVPADARRANAARLAEMRAAEIAAQAAEKAAKDSRVAVVQSPRWDFQIEDVGSVRAELEVQRVRAKAKKERSEKSAKLVGAVGWRYGVPLNDRKKGLRKIPHSVDV